MKFKNRKLETFSILTLIVLVSGIIPLVGINLGYSSIEAPKSSSTEEITINSPEETAYREPMSGYYPATYGFENDDNYGAPEGWYLSEMAGCTAQVIESVGDHSKVLELYDSHSTNYVLAYQSISNDGYGSIEFWMRNSDVTYQNSLQIYTGTNYALIFGIMQDKFKYWDGSWYEFGSPEDNTWYHITIDYESTTGGYPEGYQGLSQYHWRLWIDEVECGVFSFGSNGEPDKIEFGTQYGNGALFYAYIDAIGYSWDPYYNIDDNLNEGLLLDIEPDYLDNMEYTIDGGQNNIAILGDSVIPFPDLGTYTLEVSGDYGDVNYYGSKEFTIAGNIDIITPVEGKIYTPRIYGNYPATYSFETDDNYEAPEEWYLSEMVGCTAQIIESVGDHSKVLELYDSVFFPYNYVLVYQSISNDGYGSIEFWMRNSDVTYQNSLQIYTGTNYALIFGIMQDKFKYWDGSWHEFGSPEDNTWYHIRIDYESTTGGYPGGYLELSQYHWRLWIDEVECGVFSFGTNGEPDKIEFGTQYGNSASFYAYIDAIGYSWDPYYKIGENSYDAGHYPGTYSFEDVEDGGIHDDWISSANAQIIAEKDEHRKVYELLDDSAEGVEYIYDDWDSAQDHGTVEFWMRFTSMEQDEEVIFSLRNSANDQDLCCLKVNDGKFKTLDYGIYDDIINVYPDVNKWYHIKLVFKGSYTDTGYGGIQAATIYMYRIYINGELTFTQLTSYYDYSDQTDPKFLQVYTSDASSDITVYFDAVGYSWDPAYYIGNNRLSGFFLDFLCETELIDIKYELNGGSEKSITGKTILPITLDGLYTVKVMGTGVDTAYYESEIREYYTAPVQNLDNHWGVTAINADDVWATYCSRGEGVKVLIIDTGIDTDHPDLNYNGGINLDGSSEDPPEDTQGHGTQCAGIIGAIDNDFGCIGVAPEVELYAARISATGGGPGGYPDTDRVISAIQWGINNNMDIISMSLRCKDDSRIEEKLIDAYNQGIVLIAASGNENDDSLAYPAAYDVVISVGAIGTDYYRWSLDSHTGSNYGANLNLVAPGERISSTFKNDGYKGFILPFDDPDVRGTSFACPMVVGVCALIFSASQTIYGLPGSNRVETIRSILEFTACKSIIPNYFQHPEYYGAGLVDAYTAVSMALFL
ncbi:MAG: S8 family serine peptidase [Promethearchaeota archaeon]